MKVLMINGSPHGKGCIHTALTLAAEVLNKEGIEPEEIHVGNKDIRVLAFMQRLFYSCRCDLHMKVGASVVSCRRGGNSATFEAMNQFFGINGMPTVPSPYWNDVHGYTGEDVLKDLEGCETIRNMATNMAFMIKSIQAGKEQFGKPDVKHTQFFNFIR